MFRRSLKVWMGLALALLGESSVRAGLVVASDAAGAPPLVAVVRARDADGICQEIATRIIAELMADGVPVMALTCAAVDAACLAISDTRASATLLVQRRAGVPGVEVRAGDAGEPSATQQNSASSASSASSANAASSASSDRLRWLAQADSGGGAAALAVRTVELLRAMLLESADRPLALSTQGGSRTSATRQKFDDDDDDDIPKVQAAPPLPLAPTGPHKIALTVGLAMIGSFAGLHAAFGPTLRLSRRTSDHVDVSLLLAGPAFAGDQQDSQGFTSVAVREEMASLETDLLAMPWKGVVLRTGVGIGIFHIHVDGRTNGLFGVNGSFGPEQVVLGRSGGGTSAALSWSVGTVVNIRSDFGLFLDARLFAVTPTPVVLMNGIEMGRAGNPGVVLACGVELRI